MEDTPGSGLDVSVVVPVFNEAANLEALYRTLVTTLENASLSFEIVFVDDGSRDRSLEILRDLSRKDGRVRYASFSRNFGHEAASTCGFRMVRGRTAVLMDADLQDPPELIPEMHAKWKEGYEVVYARRLSRSDESVMKRLTAILFYRVIHWFGDTKIPVDVGDFRLVDRRVADVFNRLPERNRFVRGMIHWVGYRQASVEYHRPPRKSGTTKYNWAKLLLLSADALCGFSLAPLRLCILLGASIVVVSFVIALIIVFHKLLLDLQIPGYALLATGIFFLGGVQLTFLGVIGEYVGKIFTEVQGRPLYIIQEGCGDDAPR